MAGADNHRLSYGAYGFRLVLEDPDAELRDLQPAPDDATPVAFGWRLASALRDEREASGSYVRVSFRRGWALTVRREPASALLDLPKEISLGALVHPYSTMCLAILARWRDDVTLHGGAFYHAGRVWGICGERTAGKSSMLAMLSTRGVPIVADDLIVIREREVLAGPHCVDLRPDAARRFPDARSLGILSTRERFRLSAQAPPPRAPIGGIFLLEWHAGEDVEIEPVDLADRLRALYEHQYAGLLEPPDERAVLSLLELPMWRLRRPKRWEDADAAVALLLEAAT